VSTPEALATATDKSLLPALCRQVGLSSPPTSPAHAVDPHRLTYPAIVKPTESVAARDGGALVHTTAEVVSEPVQMEALLRRRSDEDLLVQPYLTGQLSAVCGVAWKGELVCAVHQTSPRIWPPDRGISSFAVTVPPDTELERKVGRLVDLVGWSGVFGLQYLRTCEGPVVLDLNPRIYGSTALAVAAGVNLPAIWLDLLLGDEPAVPAYRVGVHYRVEETDPRAVAVIASQRHYRAALAGLLPRRHTVHAVFSWRDPQPSVVTLHKLFHRGRSALPRPSRTAGIVASSTRASSSSDRLRT
jgi:carbamoyl-phosphate synthase large subunit